jgi:hypothetical protein
MEKILASFAKDTAAYDCFLEYARICREEPNRINPERPFRRELHASINEVIPNSAQSVDRFIIAEMLKREGIDVSWREK